MADLTPPRRDEDLIENGAKPTLRLARWMELIANQFSNVTGDVIGFDDAVIASRSDARQSQLQAKIDELTKRIECLEQFNGR